jgi:hypothetical protein
LLVYREEPCDWLELHLSVPILRLERLVLLLGSQGFAIGGWVNLLTIIHPPPARATSYPIPVFPVRFHFMLIRTQPKISTRIPDPSRSFMGIALH